MVWFVFESGATAILSNRSKNLIKKGHRISRRVSTTTAVEGMSCEQCELTVEGALRTVTSVTGATSDRNAGQASVAGVTDITALVETVKDAGCSAP